MWLVIMATVRKAINKVLDRALSDIDPSKEEQFAEEFSDFLQTQGIKLKNSNYVIFLDTSNTFHLGNFSIFLNM